MSDEAVPSGTDPHSATARELLSALDDRPLAEHPEAYGRIHGELHQALAAIDDAGARPQSSTR